MTLFEELKGISAVVFTDWWSGKFSTDVGICAEDGGAQTLDFFFSKHTIQLPQALQESG